MYKQAIEPKEPPQGLHLPELHEPLVLCEEDAAEFYAGLETVRAALVHKYYLKKDREFNELVKPQSKLIGIKNEDKKLVAGAMVIFPISREVARTYTDYPWDAKGGETALISALWTDKDWLRKGFATASIQKAIDLAREGNMNNVLTGIANGNPVIGAFQKAADFRHVHSRVREAQGDQPEYTINYYRLKL